MVDLNAKKKIPVDESIVKVCGGAAHLVILTGFVTPAKKKNHYLQSTVATNKLYVYGRNNVGQLGVPRTIEDVPNLVLLTEICEQRKLLLENKIVDVTCGFQHTVLLLQNGTVLACGDNSLRYAGLIVASNSHLCS